MARTDGLQWGPRVATVHWIRELRRPVGLFVLTIAAGTVGLMAIEGVGWIDALWFVVGTLLTVGLGEPAGAMSPAGRLFTVALIVSGVSVAGYTVAQLGAIVADGRLVGYLRERRRDMQLEDLRDHYVVVGFGRLGREVAMDLHAHGEQVVVIDTDARLLADAEGIAIPLVGDASSDAMLHRARVPFARGVAIATPSAPLNVYLTLSVRHLAPNAFIVVRIDERDAAAKATRSGANAIVSPFASGGSRMAQQLTHPHAAQFLEQVLGRDFPELGVGDVAVPAGSPLVGTLGDLQIRDRFGVSVVAMRQPDGTLLANPRASDVLGPGCVAIVVGPKAAIQALRAAI